MDSPHKGAVMRKAFLCHDVIVTPLSMLLFIMFWCVNSLRSSDAYMRQNKYYHWFSQWLGSWSAPSHYLNQYWNIVNSKLRDKLQWDLQQNSCIFIPKSAFQNVVCEMAAILSRPLLPEADDLLRDVIFTQWWIQRSLNKTNFLMHFL